MQNENQETLSLLPCSKSAGYSNLTKNPPPPSLRRYRARQKNSLHSDRQLGSTKYALADMDGRLCASQVAEQSMQHPAKGRHEDRSYIKADLLDCPNRIACLLPYPSCPATTKNRPRPPIVSLASDTTSEISGYRQPNRKNASDPSASLMLLGRPRLIDVVAPCLSPAPQSVLSRCAVEPVQGSHRPALSRARAQVRAVLPLDMPPSQIAPQRDTPRTPRLPSRPRRP